MRFYIGLLFVAGLSIQSIGQRFIKYFSEVSEIVGVGDYTYFVANDGVHGLELWQTKGKSNQASLVRDIEPGSSGSSAKNLFSFNGKLYFVAYNKIYGEELWTTDGTESGTQLVKNIKQDDSNSSNGSSPQILTIRNNELYFTASDDGNSPDLWKTNGTEEGTVKVQESDYGIIKAGITVGTDVFFIRNYGTLLQLNESGSISEISIDDNYYIDELNAFNGSLYFITHSSYRQNIRLYRFRLSSSQLTLLKEFDAPTYGSIEIDNFTEYGDDVFFTLRTDFNNGDDTDVIWKTNGTTEGTVTIKTFTWDRHWSGAYIQNLIAYEGEIYFRSGPSQNFALWKTNGLESGTKKVVDTPISEYIRPAISRGTLYFVSEFGYLWTYSKSRNESSQFSDVKLPTYNAKTILRVVNDTCFFKGDDGTGLALWSNVADPEIALFQNTTLKNGAIVSYISKVDSCVVKSYKLVNQGKRELTIGKVDIKGSDFYIQGELPQQLQPGEDCSFEVTFFPNKETSTMAEMTIHTNDSNENLFRITLSGRAAGYTRASNCFGNSLTKELAPSPEDRITISNHSIRENRPVNSFIGKLSLSSTSSPVVYDLVSGIGDSDNNLFTIKADSLLAASEFNFEEGSILSIRIRATDQIATVVKEQSFAILVENDNEIEKFDECVQRVYNMSYGLNDVVYTDNNTIVAVGENGAVIRSHDNGQTWENCINSNYVDLLKVQFIDSVNGYILGYYNVILKTEDGGHNWFQLGSPSSSYPFLRNLHFISVDTGFVFGEDGKFYKTINGGQSWSNHTTGYEDFLDAYFFDGNVGFVCGGSGNLLKTENGGATWKKIDMEAFGWNTTFVDVHFINEDNGLILTSDGKLIKTSDGGNTWISGDGVAIDYATGLYFKNENEAFVIGGWGSSRVYYSNDAGNTWSSVSLKGGGSLMGISASPDGESLCVVGRGTSLGSTSESGRSIYLGNKSLDFTLVSILKPVDFFEVNFVTDSIGYIFGEETLKTLDGGITWSRSQLESSYNLLESHFVTREVGFAISMLDVYKTIDGGESWKKLDEENTITDNNHLRNVYFLNANIGFVFGWGAAMYKTVDGGESWLAISEVNSASTSIEDMFFFDSERGFAVSGNPAEILKTNDGGITWIALNEFYLKWLHDIHFMNSNEGIAVGNNGFVLRTNDGGETWSEIKTGIGFNFVSLSFVDEQTGYVACNNNGGLGALYMTNDRGLTWTSVSQFGSLFGSSVSNRNVFVVGERGTVLKIADTSEPSIPGYISGSTLTWGGNKLIYTVPNNSSSYLWSVTGLNKIEQVSNRAVVHWVEPGVFELSVLSFNSCGVGNTRNLSVVVDSIPTPAIIGKDSVFTGLTEVEYSTRYNENTRYLWSIEGEISYNTEENKTYIDWGQPGLGKIEVIEIRKESGAMAKAVLDVVIGEVITGLELQKLLASSIYPNPAENFVQIESLPNSNMKLTVMDVRGMIYLQAELKESTQQIDLRMLPDGIYLFEFTIQSGRVVKKVVKR